MTITPHLQTPYQIEMAVTDPRHFSSAGTVGFKGTRSYAGILGSANAAAALDDSGKTVAGGAYAAELGSRIGADAVLRANASVSGGAGFSQAQVSFADTMLKAIDGVSGSQNTAAALMQQAIVDPDSVDIHDVTIAESEASMSLGIARTILSRLTSAWKEIINTR